MLFHPVSDIGCSGKDEIIVCSVRVTLMPIFSVPYSQEKRLLYIFAGQRGTEFLRYN